MTGGISNPNKPMCVGVERQSHESHAEHMSVIFPELCVFCAKRRIAHEAAALAGERAADLRALSHEKLAPIFIQVAEKARELLGERFSGSL